MAYHVAPWAGETNETKRDIFAGHGVAGLNDWLVVAGTVALAVSHFAGARQYTLRNVPRGRMAARAGTDGRL